MNNFLHAYSMAKFIQICIFVSISHFTRVDAALTYVNRGCTTDNGNYTENSTYQHNLNLLFSNLSSQASRLKFHNMTFGDVPNRVHGLFQCRGDLSLGVCRGCVEDATRKIVQECPLNGEAIVWYYECMLRYANRSISSMFEWGPSCSQRSLVKVINYGEFAPTLSNTMNDLINGPTVKLHNFATKEANMSSIDILYCLAQCTPDLDGYGCNSCLETAFAELRSCCNASVWAKVFLPSCQLRYDMNPFYNDSKQIVHSTPRTATEPGKIVMFEECIIGMKIFFPIL
ncbi:cysteine-rich repeat secretory protein 58-like [Beta vulgaris subsp. vulgaris]|uniref:cysteine-rich repeat secretory protein 58-like n=1 Tax=Beta vulgaris subsp. vulgaris TaxID=3555 RepID=UPI002036720E|nr:cysteine-rich repeat secretory protein 58-like [Beta vulgaris subsp. vulgaris]